MVSAATCSGPGRAAFNGAGATGAALAASGGVTAAAAPTRPAPLRKLRRLESADWRRFDIAILPRLGQSSQEYFFIAGIVASGSVSVKHAPTWNSHAFASPHSTARRIQQRRRDDFLPAA